MAEPQAAGAGNSGQDTSLGRDRSRGLRHAILFALFLSYGLGTFAYPYFFSMEAIIVSLRHSPLFALLTSPYVGFALPFGIALVLAISSFKLYCPSPRSLSRESWIFLLLIPASMILSRYWPFGVYVSRGGGDPILLAAVFLYVYRLVSRNRPEQAALMAYPLGFLVGLVSDIEAEGYARVTPGGYGVLDGDFILPLALLVGVVLLVSTKPWVMSNMNLAESKRPPNRLES